MGYDEWLTDVRETQEYTRWFASLRDRKVRARIEMRIYRLGLGNPGDVRSVGGGVSELRIHFGPGYRVYFRQQGCEVVILLAGGDKNTQQADIRKARVLATQI
ncbi:MAG: type II toxin-antitoxin system RelE/ParE family toxin [Gammaproteobacteria bacterium]